MFGFRLSKEGLFCKGLDLSAVGQAVSGVLFLSRHLPLVPGDESAVSVVVEAGDAL